MEAKKDRDDLDCEIHVDIHYLSFYITKWKYRPQKKLLWSLSFASELPDQSLWGYQGNWRWIFVKKSLLAKKICPKNAFRQVKLNVTLSR